MAKIKRLEEQEYLDKGIVMIERGDFNEVPYEFFGRGVLLVPSERIEVKKNISKKDLEMYEKNFIPVLVSHKKSIFSKEKKYESYVDFNLVKKIEGIFHSKEIELGEIEKIGLVESRNLRMKELNEEDREYFKRGFLPFVVSKNEKYRKAMFI